MKSGINLTTGRKQVNAIYKKAFYISVGIFAFTVVISIALIGYRLILNNSFNSLSNQEQTLNSQILSLQEKMTKYVQTQQRLKDARTIIAKRSATNQKIDEVTKIVSGSAQLTDISGSDDSVEMTVQSDNLASLNDLMEQKILELSKDKKKGIKKIDIESFGLNPKTLIYQAVFEVDFK
jgi:hypothetical protein